MSGPAVPREDLAAGDRAGMIEVMTDHERSVLLSFIAGYAPGVFDAAVAARSWPSGEVTFEDELWDRVDAKLAEEAASDPDGYCTVCGANVSWFCGYDGPRHFRGPHKLTTGTGRRELFDAGHEPVVAWRYPDGTDGGTYCP